MTGVDNFQPDWASPPGDTIRDILAERRLSAAEFADQIGQPPDQIHALLNGEAMISLSVARRLSSVLGASVEFWMARDYRYRETLARVEAAQKDWVAALPVDEMMKLKWLTAATTDRFGACLRFFGSSSVAAWQANYREVLDTTAFRTSNSFQSQIGAVAAWLRAGELKAETITCDSWDAAKFRAALVDVRTLTKQKDPERFLPRLQALCAASGVAIVILRAPSGCKASGATRFLSTRKAVLQLSFRYLSDDQFWFTFFHEAGHLLLHGERRLFLEGTGAEERPREEEEASEFAARTLIPKEEEATMLRLPARTDAVIRFATHIGISPGIVVGQLQHHRRLGRNQLNGLKRSFEWQQYTITRGKT
jgi:HTH-type transcriptional regulator/antitoxin HigA